MEQPTALSVFAAIPAATVVSSLFPAAAEAGVQVVAADAWQRSPRVLSITSFRLFPVRQWVLSVPFALRYRWASRSLLDPQKFFCWLYSVSSPPPVFPTIEVKWSEGEKIMSRKLNPNPEKCHRVVGVFAKSLQSAAILLAFVLAFDV